MKKEEVWIATKDSFGTLKTIIIFLIVIATLVTLDTSIQSYYANHTIKLADFITIISIFLIFGMTFGIGLFSYAAVIDKNQKDRKEMIIKNGEMALVASILFLISFMAMSAKFIILPGKSNPTLENLSLIGNYLIIISIALFSAALIDIFIIGCNSLTRKIFQDVRKILREKGILEKKEEYREIS